MAITTDQFLDGVKRRVSVPASQPLLTDADMLAHGDYAMRIHLVPLLKSVNQEYFVVTSDTQLVANQAEYQIPYRAVGRTLRDLKLKDSAGAKQDLVLVASEDEHLYRSGSIPAGFYFKGDKVVVVPTPSDTTYSLEFWWELQPSKFIQVSSCGVVQTVSAPTVTVATLPATLTTGTVIDFVQGISGNSIIAYDKTVTNAAGSILTFGAGVVPSALVAGDYVAPKQFTPVLQIPDEAAPFLETHTAALVLGSISDFEGKDRLKGDAAEERDALLKLLEPRVKGETTKIINRKGLVRGQRGGRILGSGYYY